MGKDTPVSYFNDTRMHVEPIEKHTKDKALNGENANDRVLLFLGLQC